MSDPSGTAPMLDVRGLKKSYGDVEAVRELTFNLAEGEFACIVGPSGAGKTTLLKCISGLLAPSAGEIVLAGRPVDGPPEGMAVVFQEYGRSLFPWMTVAQNVELPLRERKIAKDRRRRLVDEALEAVGLTDVPDSHPWQLSGGMQQRVAIARAVAYQPQVLLMDEPFAAVDAQTRADLEDLVRSVWRDFKMTVLFVTHDIDESIYLGQRVIVLSNRPTVIQDDIAIELPPERDQIATRALAEFTELRTRIHQEIRLAKGQQPG